ncbi:extracellular catalytic domain type 1 short-chain-length polyhydroxyalkanoate depolymerase [Undibacterium terreum]|nr:PHB depolymerase family esterase [Undibacterium terreum]
MLKKLPNLPLQSALPNSTLSGFRSLGTNPLNLVGTQPAFVKDLLEQLGVQAKDNARDFPHHEQPDGINVPEDATQFIDKVFTNKAGTRTYKLFIPDGYQGQPLPLIVMLHGCTQDSKDFAAGTGMNQLANEKNCFVAYPQQTQAHNSSKCWNWFKAVDQQRDQGEPSIIAGITRQIIREYRIDTDKVYVAGLSAGGAMAAILGNLYPDLYAGVGVHSGLPYGAATDLPSALAAMKNGMTSAAPRVSTSFKSIPIIVFHGDKDTTVNPKNGDHIVQQYMRGAKSADNASGFSDAIQMDGAVPGGRSYTLTSHRDGSGKPVAEHWSVHGAGHAWAGGTRMGSYTDPEGPNASHEMLRFFLTDRK